MGRYKSGAPDLDALILKSAHAKSSLERNEDILWDLGSDCVYGEVPDRLNDVIEAYRQASTALSRLIAECADERRRLEGREKLDRVYWRI